jgi:hypothetical protein
VLLLGQTHQTVFFTLGEFDSRKPRANATKTVKKLGKERIIKGSFEAFAFEGKLGGMTHEQVQGEMA